MTYILSVINQKGGVGKTTTVHAIGAKFVQDGKKVLFVDFDPQRNLSWAFNVPTNLLGTNAVFTNEPIKEQIIQTPSGDIVPGTNHLMLSAMKTGEGVATLLKEALRTVSKNYDLIIIDTPPSLNALTINALTASDGVLVLAQADIFSLQGFSDLAETVETIRRTSNKALKVLGVLITRFSNRAVLTRQVSDMIEGTAGDLKTKLYKTKIRESIAVKEAQALRRDLFSHSPKSNAAKDYKAFIEELVQDLKKG